MNLLIIGGLLVVGVLAIVGIVLLSLGESRAPAAKQQLQAPPPNEAPTNNSEPANHPAVAERATANSNNSDTSEKGLTTLAQDEMVPALNGQFHELANEIRNLHDQAWQLEQRLGVLTEMVDHIERSRNEYASVEEDQPASSDAPVS